MLYLLLLCYVCVWLFFGLGSPGLVLALILVQPCLGGVIGGVREGVINMFKQAIITY